MTKYEELKERVETERGTLPYYAIAKAVIFREITREEGAELEARWRALNPQSSGKEW